MPRRLSDPVIELRVRDMLFRIAKSVVDGIPEAAGFLAFLIDKGVHPTTATNYLRRVARARRTGLLNEGTIVPHPLDRTAVKAYWTWVEISYEARVSPVLRALVDANVRRGLTWLRIGSLVPPSQDPSRPKRIPHWTMPREGQPSELQWRTSTAWTLHTPTAAVAPHADPCPDCLALELTEEQMRVVAAVYYRTWGDREPSTLPPETPLFGQPPRTGLYAPDQKPLHTGKIVALLRSGPLADAIETSFRGSVTEQQGSFMTRLRDQNPAVVVIDLAAAGDQLEAVLAAVRAAAVVRVPAIAGGPAADQPSA